MRACVLGAGAVGGWVAARLALAGHEVTALTSSGALGEIRLTHSGEDENAALVPGTPPADLLVIAVKAPALGGALQTARRWIGPDTLIVPMLNGLPFWFEPLRSVDPDGAIAAALPIDQVIGCVVHASCRRLGPGHVEMVHADKLILGEPGGGMSGRAAALCDLFEGAGIHCEQSGDVRHAIWYKLWGNATLNPLSALTRSTADKLLGDPVTRAFMAQAMDELAAIGAAIGCPVEDSAEDRMAVTARLGAFKTSMLQDVEAGRRIEIEALVGAPLEIARRCAIASPQLERIYAMTRLLADTLES